MSDEVDLDWANSKVENGVLRVHVSAPVDPLWTEVAGLFVARDREEARMQPWKRLALIANAFMVHGPAADTDRVKTELNEFASRISAAVPAERRRRALALAEKQAEEERSAALDEDLTNRFRNG